MFVRIKSIELTNWRNVASGKIMFPCYNENDGFAYQSDITGIYGQNGSGKTTLVFAFSLLKTMLSGKSYRESLQGNIAIGADEAGIVCEFCIDADAKTDVDTDSKKKYLVTYEIKYTQEKATEKLKVSIFNEATGWGRRNTVFNVAANEGKHAFTPDAKRSELFGNAPVINTKLLVQKLLCVNDQRSFIFSDALYKELSKTQGKNHDYAIVLDALRQYGKYNLFVLSNWESGLILTDEVLPFTFWVGNASGTIGVPIDRPIALSQNNKIIMEEVIKTINTVLIEIIPSMQITIESLGTELLRNGDVGERVQLVRKLNVNGKEYKLSLKYESAGVKKIVSLLHVFIAAYNNPNITLVVDELDANIFEYLLGELLQIMHESGKGQLIFTAHNLRPLEVLDSQNVVFTTTNPNNRYTKMQDVKESNNMRLCFFRDITLGYGHGGDELYAHTNSLEIAHAMRKVKARIATLQNTKNVEAQ